MVTGEMQAVGLRVVFKHAFSSFTSARLDAAEVPRSDDDDRVATCPVFDRTVRFLRGRTIVSK